MKEAAAHRKGSVMKKNRKTEIGWMNYDDEKEDFKQVRTKRGGGTRKVDISKDAQKNRTEEGVGLFFPNGRSSLGSLTDFELDLKDYQEVTVDDTISVGQLYKDTKLSILRFYLTTRKKQKQSPHSHSADLATPLENQESPQNQCSSLTAVVATPTATFETISSDVIFLSSTTSEDFSVYSHTDNGIEDAFESSSDVVIGPFSENEPLNLDDTLLVSPQTVPSSEKVKKILVVHRGQVLRELIAHFCDDGLPRH